jgi:hypothetical protein
MFVHGTEPGSYVRGYRVAMRCKDRDTAHPLGRGRGHPQTTAAPARRTVMAKRGRPRPVGCEPRAPRGARP